MKRKFARIAIAALLFACGQPAESGTNHIESDDHEREAAHDTTDGHSHDDGHEHDDNDH